MSGLFEPGFFANGVVRTAALAGGVAALACGVIGVFAVMRRQAFSSEALGDVGATGGSAAYLVSVSPLWGFVAAALVGAGAISNIGRRSRHADLSTGVVLGAALGLAALFLYFDTTHSSTTGASIAVLFGSMFGIAPSLLPVIVSLSGVVLVLTLGCYRMLLLATVNADLASARGVPVRIVGTVFLFTVALAVSLSALAVGAVLSLALLIGPAATALRLARRPGRAVVLSALIGIGSTWLGILLAYDSYYWPPVGRGWPVSFLIVAIIFTTYLGVSLASQAHTHRKEQRTLARAALEQRGAT